MLGICKKNLDCAAPNKEAFLGSEEGVILSLCGVRLYALLRLSSDCCRAEREVASASCSSPHWIFSRS